MILTDPAPDEPTDEQMAAHQVEIINAILAAAPTEARKKISARIRAMINSPNGLDRLIGEMAHVTLTAFVLSEREAE